MQEIELYGHDHAVDGLAKDFIVTQIAKAHFLEYICHLLDDEIDQHAALSYFLPESRPSDCKKESNDALNVVRTKAFCYAARIFTAIGHNDWVVVSDTIDSYNLPLTIGSVRNAFKKARNDAVRVLAQQTHCDMH
ncbi:hypothetical protein QWI17_03820 [Gilvimarinus sp. SDUM040013]|uniref:Uncharacterized protein n=1 Tax=Gilvimarinus gilvus TaxID=3058038 RepID=A0ABU4S4Q4_9GAMM|nr:hypothetical protein [Gilvimarinus sp. SDUM040013]MDO3384966.1 hypothetical protein [Gilvimarinus sp. SDUM040013]MDX6851492.1 hypothetical protein [Gilvimarinus sp. SDUM040013]